MLKAKLELVSGEAAS